MNRVSSRRQRGVSLVEVAIASVILGACGVVLWGVIEHQAKVTSEDRSLSITDRAHDAILAYAYLHGELPCPTPVTTGVEVCDGNSDGFLPYLTLGLPEPAAGRIRYRVSPDTKLPVASNPYGVVVSQRSGPFGDLSAQVVPLAAVLPAGHEPLFDICHALLSSASSGGTAYALAMDPGNTALPSSSLPSAAPHAAYQPVGRAQLATKLHCSSLAVAGRAHFNAVLAAETMERAMEDILAQLKMVNFTYDVDTSQGAYFEANSIHSLYRANMKRLGALAAFQASNGANSAALTLANVKLGMAGTYTAALALNVVRFAINQNNSIKREKTMADLLEQAKESAATIKARAITGSSSAFFLEDKWSPPAP